MNDLINKIIDADFNEFLEILPEINSLRIKSKKNNIKLCSIINAKSGKCPENCAFCAQSKYHRTDIDVFSLITVDEILNQAKIMESYGAHRFSIVTSGTAIQTKKDKSVILKAVEMISGKTSLKCCASLGIIDDDFFKDLIKAGLNGYHHNLETSESFFHNICSTHKYQDDVDTVKRAKDKGLYVCSCGIFGLGENWGHRIELANTLKELDVDSIPINFLNPIRGTRLEKAQYLNPLECLKIVAVYRLIHQDKDIRICGGREYNLRDLQVLLISSGANGLMVGNYLTTKGRQIEDDLKMLQDLDLKIADY
jgi:biotin synthase